MICLERKGGRGRNQRSVAHSTRSESLAFQSHTPTGIPVRDLGLLVRHSSQSTSRMLRIVGLVFAVIAVETAKAQRYEDVRDFLGLLENDGTKASGVTVTDSNVFIDTVLSQRVPALIRTTPSLYPTAQIPFHNFKIKKNGLGIRDLKVNLTEGAVRGLDTLVRRVGDCNRPIQVAGNTSITCTLDLSGLNVTYTAQTKGDNVLSTRKTIWVHVAVRNTTARFEATANPGKDGSVRTFLVEQITLSASYDSNLDLNIERSRAFRSEVRNYTNAELYKILYGSYLTVLNQAVAGTFFPRA